VGVVTSGGSSASSRSATTSATGSYESTPAVAGSAALVASPKMVVGAGTASTGGTAVTLYGSSIFSNANYRCMVTNTSSTAGLQVSSKTTSGFTVTSSSGSPTFDYTCFGK
jgi:ribose 5-phosphate isomerase